MRSGDDRVHVSSRLHLVLRCTNAGLVASCHVADRLDPPLSRTALGQRFLLLRNSQHRERRNRGIVNAETAAS
jgi:hypothetical protein